MALEDDVAQFAQPHSSLSEVFGETVLARRRLPARSPPAWAGPFVINLSSDCHHPGDRPRSGPR